MEARDFSAMWRTVLGGVLAGIVGGILMGLFAMMWGLAKKTGLWTPLYHIGSLVTGPDEMMVSMERAKAGGQLFLAGAAMTGLVVHMRFR